jgi:hypothetical protein
MRRASITRRTRNVDGWDKAGACPQGGTSRVALPERLGWV